jgi:hypothetical protein
MPALVIPDGEQFEVKFGKEKTSSRVSDDFGTIFRISTRIARHSPEES